MMRNNVCQQGRYPDGGKKRWSRARKRAAKQARVEQWLSMAKQWKVEKERRRTAPACCGAGKWVDEFPWELWGLIFDNLSAVDRLSCVTSTKTMMKNYEKESELAELREDARIEVQLAREERYAQRLKAAVNYYILYNIELRQPGVGYRYVSKRFRVGRPDLQEEVVARFDIYQDSDSDM